MGGIGEIMNILAIGNLASGCFHARVSLPLTELGKRGHDVIMTDTKDGIALGKYDIVLFNNLLGDIENENGASTLHEMVSDFRSLGAKIVYDCDDAQDIRPDILQNRKTVDACMESYRYFLKEADLVTTTTDILAEHLRQGGARTVAVLPNCLNPESFPERDRSPYGVKIGFAGSQSHELDIDLVLPSIDRLKRDFGVLFEMLGLKKHGYKTRRPVVASQYPAELARMSMDIGVCPLISNDFNRHKSPIKFLEYSLVRTAVLASNVPPYTGEMKSEWLVNDGEWYDRLKELIRNSALRERMANEQKQWVLEHRDIRKEVVRWEKEYKKLLRRFPFFWK